MTYASQGLIQASDFNNLTGTTTSTTSGKLNTIYGIGAGIYGYGQTPIDNVNTDEIISNSEWASLNNAINIISRHQSGVSATKTGSLTLSSATVNIADTSGIIKGMYIVGTGIPSDVSVTVLTINANANIIMSTTATSTSSSTLLFTTTQPLPLPILDSKIKYISTLASTLTTINSNHNNAIAQGSTTSNTLTYTSRWQKYLTFSYQLDFQSGDKARYFFNAGGQIALTFSHPVTTGVDSLFNLLASACGTIVLSGVSDNATATIAGTKYYGTTKVGGAGVSQINEDIGYYALNSQNQELFKQTGTGTILNYLQSYISVSMKTNGTQGNNNDSGSSLFITITWDCVPDSLSSYYISAGSATTCTVRYPSSTYLANTWGTVGITLASVTGV